MSPGKTGVNDKNWILRNAFNYVFTVYIHGIYLCLYTSDVGFMPDT